MFVDEVYNFQRGYCIQGKLNLLHFNQLTSYNILVNWNDKI